MSGTILTAGLVAASVALACATAGACGGLVASAAADGGADAAALAAADVASGLLPGVPCEAAAALAAANRVTLTGCTVAGPVVTVEVARGWLIPVTARATAGPPG